MAVRALTALVGALVVLIGAGVLGEGLAGLIVGAILIVFGIEVLLRAIGGG